LRALLAFIALLFIPAPGFADNGLCAGSAMNVAFGALGLASLQNATTVGSVTSTCGLSIALTGTFDFCASIGVGTKSVSQTDRRMYSGANYISYQLYTDSGYSNPYQYTGLNMVAVTYNLLLGVTVPFNVYGKILSSGALIPPGTYMDTYTTGAQAAISNDGSAPSGNPATECTGNSNTHWWNTTAFTVSVTLSTSCSVSAVPLAFGSVGVLSANTDATTNLSISCTYTTPYSVALSAGNATGATTSTRAMTNGGSKVYYFLYQDSARSVNWGNNIGVDTVAGVGTGSAQSLSVYGRVPTQTTPTIGNYMDTVVVTVNY
jgi:spore coat protein U-like protein